MRILAGLAVAASIVVIPATAQAAAAPQEGYEMVTVSDAGAVEKVRLKNRATNLCLTAEWGDHIHATTCDGRWSQDWYWEAGSEGWLRLRNDETKRCLDGTRHGGSIYANPCNGGRYQNWSHVGGRMTQHESGQLLDGNHAGSVYLSPANGGDHQIWDS